MRQARLVCAKWLRGQLEGSCLLVVAELLHSTFALANASTPSSVWELPGQEALAVAELAGRCFEISSSPLLVHCRRV